MFVLQRRMISKKINMQFFYFSVFVVIILPIELFAANNHTIGEVPLEIESSINQGTDGFKTKIKKKYKIDSMNLVENEGVPKGKFFFRGNLTSKKTKDNHLLMKMKPREIARSFIDEQKELFGISGVDNDYKLKKISVDEDGNSHAYFQRNIKGIRLKKSEIIIHIDDAGDIFFVNGTIVPLNMGNYDPLSKRKTLKKSEIKSVVLKDLKGEGVLGENVVFNLLELVSLPSEPYFVWEVDVSVDNKFERWIYSINCFSGEILLKNNGIKFNTREVKNNNQVTIKATEEIRLEKNKSALVENKQDAASQIEIIEKKNEYKIKEFPGNIGNE